MNFLYQNVLSDSDALYQTFVAQINGSLYAKDFCPDLDDYMCWTHLMMGPNLENMLIRLTIQNKKPSSNFLNLTALAWKSRLGNSTVSILTLQMKMLSVKADLETA